MQTYFNSKQQHPSIIPNILFDVYFKNLHLVSQNEIAKQLGATSRLSDASKV